MARREAMALVGPPSSARVAPRRSGSLARTVAVAPTCGPYGPLGWREGQGYRLKGAECCQGGLSTSSSFCNTEPLWASLGLWSSDMGGIRGKAGSVAPRASQGDLRASLSTPTH